MIENEIKLFSNIFKTSPTIKFARKKNNSKYLEKTYRS